MSPIGDPRVLLGRIPADILVLERFLLNNLELKAFLCGQVLIPRGENYIGTVGPRSKKDLDGCPIY